MSMGDIWSINGISFANAVSDVLEREDFTLEDLLKEDEILQEIKAKNERLIEVLTHEENIIKMIDYIIVPAPEGADDLRKFRYPYMSCQIFCCEIPEMLQAIQDDSEARLLTRLFSILQAPAPLDPYLAGYFEKTLGMLFRRLTITMMSHINKDGIRMLLLFLRHIDNYSVMQVIQRLMLPHIPFAAAQQDGSGEGGEGGGENADLSPEELILTHCHWSYFEETPGLLLDQMLLARLDDGEAEGEAAKAEDGVDKVESVASPESPNPSENGDIPAHVADLLITVLQLSPAESPLLINICNVNCLQRLFKAAFKGNRLASCRTNGSGECPTPSATEQQDLSSSLSALTVLESIVSRLSEALVLLGSLPTGAGGDGSGESTAESVGGEEITEEMVHLQQQAAEVGLLISQNIQHMSVAVKPYVHLLADELHSYLLNPSSVITLQRKTHQKCLGHRGLQLVKLVETLVRLVVCEISNGAAAAAENENSASVSAAVAEDSTGAVEDSLEREGGDSEKNQQQAHQLAMAEAYRSVLDIIPMFCRSHILKYCWELCFVYKNNSLLHLSVQRILLMILDNDTPLKLESQRYLFQETSILQRLTEMLIAKAVPPARAPTPAPRPKTADSLDAAAKSEADATAAADEQSSSEDAEGSAAASAASEKKGETAATASKPAYCYGAKPFHPFAGHLMQLAKTIEQALAAEESDGAMLRKQDSGGDGLGTADAKTASELGEVARMLERLEVTGETSDKSSDNAEANKPQFATLRDVLENTSVASVMAAAAIEGAPSNSSGEATPSTLMAQWKQFVDDYPQYFAEEEAPVVVLPPSMGGPVTHDSGNDVNDASAFNQQQQQFMFFGTSIVPPTLESDEMGEGLGGFGSYGNGEEDDDDDEEEEGVDGGFDMSYRGGKGSDDSDEEEDDDSDEDFYKSSLRDVSSEDEDHADYARHYQGGDDDDDEEEDATGSGSNTTFSIRSKYYTGYSPDDFVGANGAQGGGEDPGEGSADFNPFGFAADASPESTEDAQNTSGNSMDFVAFADFGSTTSSTTSAKDGEVAGDTAPDAVADPFGSTDGEFDFFANANVADASSETAAAPAGGEAPAKDQDDPFEKFDSF